MPINITDVDTFTDPITAPAGADPASAASIVDVVQKLANRTRWLKNLLDAARTFIGISESNRQIRVGAHRARVESGAWVPAFIESGLSCVDDTGSTGRRTVRFDASAGVELPWKGTVTGVQVQVRPGATRGSASNQMRAILQRVEANPEVMAAVETTLGGTGFVLADNNANLQLIFLTPTSPVSINGEATSGNTHRLMVLIETGVSSSAPVDDTVYDVRFTTTTEVR